MGQRVEAGRLGGAVFLVQVGDEGSLDSHCSVGIKGGTGKIFGGVYRKDLPHNLLYGRRVRKTSQESEMTPKLQAWAAGE